MTTLARSEHPRDRELDELRTRLSAREAALAERDAELARLKKELRAFEVSYREQVGRLHEELDELETAISDAELGELEKRAQPRSGEPRARTAEDMRESMPRFTSDAVRKLFRDVAKTIHPDLTTDAEARDRRHALMIEANRAYATGDEERLRRILHAWENSPEAVLDSDPDAARLRLLRRIAQVEEQIEMVAGDLKALKETPLWKLKLMVDQTAARGKDLVRDMVQRLKRDIMVARNRLEAIRSQP